VKRLTAPIWSSTTYCDNGVRLTIDGVPATSVIGIDSVSRIVSTPPLTCLSSSSNVAAPGTSVPDLRVSFESSLSLVAEFPGRSGHFSGVRRLGDVEDA
jgi:hypothetical protein